MMKQSNLSVGITTAMFAVFIFGISSVSAQVEFTIQPAVATGKTKGSTLFLTCFYPKHITDVQWVGPKGDVLPADEVIDNGNNGGESSLDLKDLSAANDGLYKCQGNTMNSKNNTEVVVVSRQVSVFDPLKFVDTEKVQAFERGTDASVFCKAVGNPPPRYVWKLGNVTINSEDPSDRLFIDPSNNLVIKNVQKSDEKTYHCGARESNHGQAIDVGIFVDVQFAPNGINVPENKVGIKNNDVTLTCLGSAEPEPTYRWHRGSSDDTSNITWITEGLQDDGKTLLLEKVTESDEGDYTCVVSNERGNDTGTVMVVVHVPPVITDQVNKTAKEGTSATIQCTASGVPEPTVVIYRNGRRMNVSSLGDTTPVVPDYANNVGKVTFQPASSTDDGPYECVATNSAGTASGQIVLTVLYAPLDTTLPTVYACPDKEAVLSCRFDANPAPDLQWGVMVDVPPPNGSLQAAESEFVNPKTRMVKVFQPFNSTSSDLKKEDDFLQFRISQVSDDSYGKYYCMAKNELGRNSAASELVKASVPDPPTNVKHVGVSTRSADIFYSPPANIHVTIDSYSFGIKNMETNSTEYRTRVAGVQGNRVGKKMMFAAKGLQHDTNYEVSVSAINCVGEGLSSPPVKFNTHPIVKPGKVIIVTPRSAASSNNLTIQWDTNGDGGGTLQKITIEYNPVTLGNNSEVKDPRVVTIDKSKPEFTAKSYLLKDLEPSTKYQVTLTISNEVETSEAAMFMFETPADEFALTRTTSKTGELGSGKQEATRYEATVTASTPAFSIIKDASSKASAPSGKIYFKTDSPQVGLTSEAGELGSGKQEASTHEATAYKRPASTPAFSIIKDASSKASAPPGKISFKTDSPQEGLTSKAELVRITNVGNQKETAQESYSDLDKRKKSFKNAKLKEERLNKVKTDKHTDAVESAKPESFIDFDTDAPTALRVPTELPLSTNKQAEISAGKVDPIMIGIIVAVVVILLVILDIICCSSRHCGLTHCIYMSCCAPPGAGKEGMKDAEEGSAEFRQEMGVVNEETPLHADQSNGDTAPEQKQEKAPKKEDRELSPGDVKMGVSASEKEPLA